jgi:hypothetical protein
MRRRALLTALAASTATTATAATSGCLSTATSLVSGPRTVGPGDEVTLAGRAVELGDPRPQATFVDQQWPYWDAVAVDDHVVVGVPLDPTTDGPGAADAVRDATITARVDGERVADPDAVLANRDDQPPVRLGVPFPSGDRVETATIAFEDGRDAHLELDAAVREVIADPPALTVDPRVPAETDGNALTVELDVANDGDTRGVLAWTSTHGVVSDAWWTHRDAIPPGESRTLTQTWDRLGSPDTGRELSVRLDWGFDDVRDTVVVARD